MSPSTSAPPVAAPSSSSSRSAPSGIVKEALDDAHVFVAALNRLRDERRGRLAQLKRNVGEPLPGRGTAWFYGLLYEGNSGWRLRHGDEYFLIATLFDLNRFDAGPLPNLGATLRRAVQSGANESSTARRLQILLDADFAEKHDSELAFRLRQTVQWLGGRQTGVPWAQTLVHLCFWGSPKRWVQKDLARSFFEAPREIQQFISPTN